MPFKFITIALLAVSVGSAGCSQNAPAPSDTAGADHDHHDHDHDHEGEAGKIEPPVAPSEAGQQYVLETAPNDAQSVIDMRKSAANDDEVVVTGRIGGSANPWIEGQAMFTVVDESLKSCNQIEGDTCPVPWDYCCETHKLKDSSALVKVVDENGDPVKTDARELLGVRELTQVTVKGKAKRDDAGNLTVLASGVFVQK